MLLTIFSFITDAEQGPKYASALTIALHHIIISFAKIFTMTLSTMPLALLCIKDFYAFFLVIDSCLYFSLLSFPLFM